MVRTRQYPYSLCYLNLACIIDTKPELADVFVKLLPLAHEWQSIGILVRVERNILQNIRREEQGVRDCLSSMLSEWLKIVDPPPTWKNIVDAVQQLDASAAREIKETLAH